MKGGAGTLFDPLRRLSVPATEEERVRQWFIGVLADSCGVPVSHMKSEVGFKLGDKQLRADILVWDSAAAPLAVVECKKPSVQLDSSVLDQAARYDMVLGVKWIILTNGNSTVALHIEDGVFRPVDRLPSYSEMQSYEYF